VIPRITFRDFINNFKDPKKYFRQTALGTVLGKDLFKWVNNNSLLQGI